MTRPPLLAPAGEVGTLTHASIADAIDRGVAAALGDLVGVKGGHVSVGARASGISTPATGISRSVRP